MSSRKRQKIRQGPVIEDDEDAADVVTFKEIIVNVNGRKVKRRMEVALRVQEKVRRTRRTRKAHAAHLKPVDPSPGTIPSTSHDNDGSADFTSFPDDYQPSSSSRNKVRLQTRGVADLMPWLSNKCGSKSSWAMERIC
jgi:hypothetical protein